MGQRVDAQVEAAMRRAKVPVGGCDGWMDGWSGDGRLGLVVWVHTTRDQLTYCQLMLQKSGKKTT